MGGGAGGHMLHPFDCPDVNSGKSLLDFFANSVNWLKKNTGALKIDGVNLSFRLRKNDNMSTGWEFVVDRGSTSGASGKFDLEGVTADTAHKRFINKKDPTKPHGMVGSTAALLGIANSALPSLVSELEEMGFLDDGGHGPYGLYFNTEYVETKTNVKEYPFNFIAIHGVRKFVRKTARARGFVDVAVDQSVLDKLRDKMHQHAIKNNPPFKVYTRIPTNFKKQPNLEKVLNTPIPINTGVQGNTKPLKERLLDVKTSPYKQKIVLKEEVARKLGIPQTQDPFAKKIYMAVHNGTLIPEMVAHEDHIEPIVDAYVLQHAIRLAGREILAVSESDFGSAKDEEGVVVGPTPELCGGTTFKYTGDFIVGGLASSFKHDSAAETEQSLQEPLEEPLEEDGEYVLERSGIGDEEGRFLQPTPALEKEKGDFKWGPMESAWTFKGENAYLFAINQKKVMAKKGIHVGVEEKIDLEEPPENQQSDILKEQVEASPIKKVIAIYPGRFQPAGRHHAAAWVWLQTMFGAQETYLATSDIVNPPNSPFAFHEKQEILKEHGVPDEKIVQTKNPYQANEITSQFDPDTTAVVFMVGEKDMKEDVRFKNVGGTLKSGKAAYYKDFKENKDKLEPLSKHGYLITAPHISLNVPGHGEMSGTSLRSFLKNASEGQFSAVMGWFDIELYNMIQSKLKMTDMSDDEGKEGQLDENFLSMDSLYSLVDEALHEKYKNVLSLNEIVSLVDEAILEKKMTKGDKNRDTRMKKKMDPHKKEFIKGYTDKGKSRKEAEGIYFATIRKQAMAEQNNINETSEEELNTNIGLLEPEIELFMAKILPRLLPNVDAEELAKMAKDPAGDLKDKLMALQGEREPVEPEDVVDQMTEVSSAAGVAGHAMGAWASNKKHRSWQDDKQSSRRN